MKKLFSILILSLFVCCKHKNTTTEQLPVVIYTTHARVLNPSTNTLEFHLLNYLEVDRHGNVRVMKKDSLRGSPSFFTSTLSLDTLSEIVNTLRWKKFDSTYMINPASSYLYCGYHYSIELHDFDKNQIVLFIPPEAPEDLNKIANIVQRQVELSNMVPLKELNLSSYLQKLSNLDLVSVTQPKVTRASFKPPKIQKEE
jgi:hypothetical protein